MSGRLQGKVAVVTGSNSGIGRGIAVAFGKEGATVVCANRQAESKAESEKGVTTNDLINNNGGKGVFMKLTFSDSESVSKLVKDVVEQYGRIDIWVNNAGTDGGFGNIWELSDKDFDAVIDINLKGTFKCIRTVSAQMIQQEPDSVGLRGRIINTGSVFGPRGFPAATAYSASKMGVMGITRAAAMDLSPYKVTINTLCPGTVVTKMTEGFVSSERLKQKALLGFGEPQDIAGAALFLASNDGKWMQGAELFIDGGFSVS